MIYHLYHQEEKKIKKEIKISSNVYQALLHHPFIGNVGELTDVVLASCVNALYQAKGEMLEVHAYHLPEEIMASVNTDMLLLQKHQMITLSSIPKHHDSKIVLLYEELLELFSKQEALDKSY